MDDYKDNLIVEINTNLVKDLINNNNKKLISQSKLEKDKNNILNTILLKKELKILINFDKNIFI